MISFLILWAAPLPAAETVLVFDPAQTRIEWTLGATLHTVHGTFQLRSGTIRFDAASGKASGELIVDARSGASGNGDRDAKMHNAILESARFPDIVLVPDRVEGTVPAQGSAALTVHGIFKLHGTEHELAVPVRVEMAPGQVTATATFAVPYIRWGLKNPSTFLLRVADKVDVQIHAIARIRP